MNLKQSYIYIVSIYTQIHDYDIDHDKRQKKTPIKNSIKGSVTQTIMHILLLANACIQLFPNVYSD